jgi:hypothetical protein
VDWLMRDGFENQQIKRALDQIGLLGGDHAASMTL